ncbi:MAG: hypothetical protein L0Y68_04555 [Candidatus Dadabacteria bacterium]|nr:hypothetical protein [Candidatus Dadabacteria bacterium]
MQEQKISQIKISSAGLDEEHWESATSYFEPKGMTGLNRNLLVSGVYGVSNEHKPGVFANDRLSISPDVSDLVALNDIDSTDTVGGNSGDFYAANDEETNPSTHNSNPKDWEFIIISYLWMLGIKGDVGVERITTDVDASFSDLAKNLDFAAEAHIEVWKRNFGMFIDFTYSKLSNSEGVTLQRIPASFNINLDAYFLLLEVGGLYRVGTWPVGSPYNNFVQKAKPNVTLELLAGGRYWYLKTDLDIKGPLGILPPEVDASEQWLDLFVGARVKLELIKKLQFHLRSDIGGFGASFSSDISWNIAAYLGYELPWYRITPIIGYRALYVDYENGSGNDRFEYKTWTYGPQIGIAFIF